MEKTRRKEHVVCPGQNHVGQLQGPRGAGTREGSSRNDRGCKAVVVVIGEDASVRESTAGGTSFSFQSRKGSRSHEEHSATRKTLQLPRRCGAAWAKYFFVRTALLLIARWRSSLSQSPLYALYSHLFCFALPMDGALNSKDVFPLSTSTSGRRQSRPEKVSGALIPRTIFFAKARPTSAWHCRLRNEVPLTPLETNRPKRLRRER